MLYRGRAIRRLRAAACLLATASLLVAVVLSTAPAGAAAASALTLDRVEALARRALDPARRLTVVIPRDEDHS